MKRTLLIVAAAGLTLVSWNATPAFAQLKLRPTLVQYGLGITRVQLGSTAHRQGIEAGDIIVRVNGQPVRSLEDLRLWVGRSGPTAQLDVIDCRTGWVNQVMVYPQNGRIGVDGQPVPLNNNIQPWPQPFPGQPMPGNSGPTGVPQAAPVTPVAPVAPLIGGR